MNSNRQIHIGPCAAEQLDRAIGDPHIGHVTPFNLLVGTAHIYVDRDATWHMTDREVIQAVAAYWQIGQ